MASPEKELRCAKRKQNTIVYVKVNIPSIDQINELSTRPLVSKIETFLLTGMFSVFVFFKEIHKYMIIISKV